MSRQPEENLVVGNELVAARDKATAFSRAHAVQLGRELIRFEDEGLHPGGKLLELQHLCRSFAGHHAQNVAKSLAERAAIEAAIGHLAADDTQLSAQALADKYGSGDSWGGHPKWSRTDWQQEVANGDTISGYWTWVVSQIQAEAEDGK